MVLALLTAARGFSSLELPLRTAGGGQGISPRLWETRGLVCPGNALLPWGRRGAGRRRAPKAPIEPFTKVISHAPRPLRHTGARRRFAQPNLGCAATTPAADADHLALRTGHGFRCGQAGHQEPASQSAGDFLVGPLRCVYVQGKKRRRDALSVLGRPIWPDDRSLRADGVSVRRPAGQPCLRHLCCAYMSVDDSRDVAPKARVSQHASLYIRLAACVSRRARTGSRPPLRDHRSAHASPDISHCPGRQNPPVQPAGSPSRLA